MAKRWYVVHAYSGFEHQVERTLKERIARAGMQDKFGDVLVPTEEVIEMRGGQKRRSERKFFPGYVLVQIERSQDGKAPKIDDESWHLIKETPKVMGFIGGTADRPLPIKDSEADAILQRVQEGVEKPKPKVLFEPGEMVRVTDGPFTEAKDQWVNFNPATGQQLLAGRDGVSRTGNPRQIGSPHDTICPRVDGRRTV